MEKRTEIAKQAGTPSSDRKERFDFGSDRLASIKREVAPIRAADALVRFADEA